MKFMLETARLQLRELEQADFEPLYGMLSDPLVMRYYPSTRDRQATQEWIDWMQERYAQIGYGLWATVLRSSGEFVGQCGLLLQRVDEQDEVEVGYLLRSQYWHQGYATEAGRACRDYAFRELGCAHVISLIRPMNMPSRAVAERNGMSIWKTTSFRGLEALVYRVDASGSAAPPAA
jgi:[ribosomal protein S5]-alanine N-acetyltransferase